MNYPAASHGVSKARQQHKNHLEASFWVWTSGAIKDEIHCIHTSISSPSYARQIFNGLVSE